MNAVATQGDRQRGWTCSIQPLTGPGKARSRAVLHKMRA